MESVNNEYQLYFPIIEQLGYFSFYENNAVISLCIKLLLLGVLP